MLRFKQHGGSLLLILVILSLLAVSCTGKPSVTTANPGKTTSSPTSTPKTTLTSNLSSGGTTTPKTTPTSTLSPGGTTTPTKTADSTPPAVSLVNPAAKSSGVDIGTTVTIVFSKPMAPATINKNNITLSKEGALVAATVDYDKVSQTVTLNPNFNLEFSTVYTGKISTAVTDPAGNHLASEYSWTFTTVTNDVNAPQDTTPPAVISVSPANNASGAAIDGAIRAVFSESINPGSLSATSFSLKQGTTIIIGVVNYDDSLKAATFSPDSNLTKGTVYTATVTTAVTDLAGNKLAANYTWSFTTAGTPPDTTPPVVSSVSPLSNATGVAITSAVTAVFSKSIDPATINTASFTLKQGANAVTGTASYLDSTKTATFTPSSSLAYASTYTATLTTAVADQAGNKLAADYTWSFTTVNSSSGGNPSNTPTLSVAYINPSNGATGVAINSAVTAVFSLAMQSPTLTTSTFTLTTGGTPVSGSVTYNDSNHTATFTPSGNLTNGTLYVATITTGALSTSNQSLSANYVWTFTTATGSADTTPPTVVTVNPGSGASGVAVNTAITMTFSEAVAAASFTNSSFTLMNGSTPVSGAFNVNGSTVTFTHSANLAGSTNYTATITTGVTDLAGNHLAANYTWSFTTMAVDTTPPNLLSVNPSSGAIGVAVNTAISMTFSEAMAPASFGSGFSLKNGSTPVNGAFTFNGSTVVFTPSALLSNGAAYTATITTDLTDLAGNHLQSSFPWSFTTRNPMTISIGTLTASPGGALVVNINISQISLLQSYQFELSYDSSLVQVIGDPPTPGTSLTNGLIGSTVMPVIGWSRLTAGKIMVTGLIPLNNGSATGQGYLVQVHFQVLGAAGHSSSLTLSNLSIFNNLGVAFAPPDIINGTVTIQ